MENNLFQLKIITPVKIIYDGLISSLIVPQENGFMGVLAHHAPLITSLSPGEITIKNSSTSQIKFKAQTRGLLEVINNTATIITDSVSS